jgi:hypothetical protein
VVISVVLDSCVIYPMPLCDTLLRAAEKALYRPYFSQEIMDGATRNLVKDGRMTEEKALRFREAICNNFPEAIVDNIPDELIGILTNHIGDRHVLAVAIKAPESVTWIVTSNLKHFKPKDLEPWGVVAISPDDFLLELCYEHSFSRLISLLEEQAAALKRPPTSFLDLMRRMEKQCPKFSSEILLRFYGQKLYEISKAILNSKLSKKQGKKKVFSGECYEIHEIGKSIFVKRKEGNFDVMVCHPSAEISGKLTTFDIDKFLAVETEFLAVETQLT